MHRRWARPHTLAVRPVRPAPHLRKRCGAARFPHTPGGLPGAPLGRGMGQPGFPMAQPRLGAAGAPLGRGMGQPGFPTPLEGCLAPRWAGGWGNPVSPHPWRVAWRPAGQGDGATRFPHGPTAGGRGWRPAGQGDGETRFPHRFTLGTMRMAHNARMENNIVLGRASPSQTLPRAGYFHLIPGVARDD